MFSADDARAMTEAGADIIVCHMGLTAGASIGAATTKSLDECVALIDEWAHAALDYARTCSSCVTADRSRCPMTPLT